MTVGLEMGGTEVLRPYIEDAPASGGAPAHPALIDVAHEVDARFGMNNIPQAVWIDEDGRIVRPAEYAVPPPVMRPNADGELEPWGMGGRSDDPQRYADKLRDWAAEGPASEHVLSPDEVIARSRPRPPEVSEAAAHFELAQHSWRMHGFDDVTLAHFGAAHTLQPDNITYKRQAYSQYSFARSASGSEMVRFRQAPREGEEAEWPFVSNFNLDMEAMQAEREREGRATPRS